MKQDKPTIGNLLWQLVDDGKAYAAAELDLAKERTLAELETYRRAAIWAGLAAVAGIALLIGLSVALILVMASLLGPYFGPVAALVVLGGLAAFFGWRALTAWRSARD